MHHACSQEDEGSFLVLEGDLPDGSHFSLPVPLKGVPRIKVGRQGGKLVGTRWPVVTGHVCDSLLAQFTSQQVHMLLLLHSPHFSA
jgi:hypothetical protein